MNYERMQSGGTDGVGELTLADLHDAHDDDEAEGQQLAGGEYVLHPGGPSHTGAIHPCEQHWKCKKRVKHRVRSSSKAQL